MMFKKGRVKKASVSIPMRKWKAGRVSHREWDSTVSDLAVHKASEEEIQRRRLIHKSKNASAARRALGERAKKLFMDPATPGQVELEMKKLAILKEVLYDHDDMNEVLKRVDNTMSSVKTLFHGAPYRTSGNPNVTYAPGSKNTTGSGPVQARDEPTTQMSLLSDSVMDKHALNEENLSSDDEGEGEEKFESKVDYERFLSILRESLNKSIPSHGPSGDATAVTPVNNGKPESRQQALNCTGEVKRKMARTGNDNVQSEDLPKLTRTIDDTITKLTIGKRDGDKKKNQSVSFSLTNESTVFPPPRPNLTASNMTYDNLQDAMESVNQNLNEMENRRGNRNQSEAANISVKSDGLAGFTATLIDAVTRLTVYVNEAEGRLLVAESRMEEMKNQNDHQRALLDALTAELMGTQDQIQTLKDEASQRKEDDARKREEFEKHVKEEVNSLRQILKDSEERDVEEINGAGDTTKKQMKNPAVRMLDEFQVLETRTGATKQKDEGEEALKSDMLSLLTALKVEDKKPSDRGHSSQSTTQILAMNNATTKGAAQTVASVESQLRHLQLQHAEAQNRLQELTQVAGFLAGKVSESQCQSSSASNGSEPVTPSTCLSSTTPSIVSGPITPREPNEEFQAMIPTNASETDDSFSGMTITSSLFANIGGDTSRPSVQSSAFSQGLVPSYTDRRIVEDYSSLKSSDRVNISEDSFQELGGRNIPSLLQSNLYGISITSDAVKILNPPSISAQDRQQPALPSFKPTGMPSSLTADARNITTSIQQTQYNLEDRIAELNQQHAEAQARLQNLIRRRSDIRSPSSLSSHSSGTGSSMKAIQISLPTEDMLKTPQIHKAPEPFKPITLDEHSFD